MKIWTLARLIPVAAVGAALLFSPPAVASADRGGCATFPSWPGRTCPTHPVIPALDQGWRETEAVPKAIYTGHHPFMNPSVLFIIWRHWGRGPAWGHGNVQESGQPRVGILLWRVRHHNGTAYYSRMRWTFRRGGARVVIRYRLRGGYWLRAS